MFYKMRSYLYVNKLPVAIILLLSAIIAIASVRSNVSFLQTEQEIIKFEKSDINETELNSTDGQYIELSEINPVITIDNDREYDRVCFSVKSFEGANGHIRLFSSYQNDFDVDHSKKVAIKGDDIQIDCGVQRGPIKILLLSDSANYNLKIDDIRLYRNNIISNKTTIAKAMLLYIALFVVLSFIFIILSRVFRNKNNATIWKLLIAGEIIAIIACFVTSGDAFGGYFHRDTADTFMDYFNMLALMSNDDPYYLKANYPALCFALLGIMHSFLLPYVKEYDSGMALRSDSISMMGFMLLFLFSAIIIYICAKRILTNENDKKYILALILAGPMLFTIQRGNILLVSFAFLMIYLLNYNSDSKKMRYIAYVALAIASGIKMYPSVFGLLTLKRKNIKETVHLALMGLIGFVIPFFVFDGISTFKEFLEGFSAANDLLVSQGVGNNFALNNLVLMINAMLGTHISLSMTVTVLVFILLVLAAVISKVRWESMFLIATACIWFPKFSFTYMLVLYIPAILEFLNERESDKNKWDGVLLAGTQIPWMLPMMPWVDRYIVTRDLNLPMSYGTLVLNVIIIYLTLRILLRYAISLLQKATGKNFSLSKVMLCQFLASCAIILLCAIGIYNRQYNPEYNFKGNGTSWKPYKIESIEDLQYLREITNNGETFKNAYFEQTKDIEYDGVTSVNPIGWGAYRRFSGNYDGQGYSIKNYYSLSDEDKNMGFFGELDGTVRNLYLENCNIGGSLVGGIAYEITGNGRVSNCYVNGLLNGYRVGGIAVINGGLIENSIALVNIHAQEPYGLYDKSYYGKSINCFCSIDADVEQYELLNERSLYKLKNYAELNNKRVLRDFDFSNWIIGEAGVLKLNNQ